MKIKDYDTSTDAGNGFAIVQPGEMGFTPQPGHRMEFQVARLCGDRIGRFEPGVWYPVYGGQWTCTLLEHLQKQYVANIKAIRRPVA